MAKALWEKPVETPSYRATSPLNRPSKGRPICNPSPLNRAERGLPSTPRSLPLGLREGRSHIYVAHALERRVSPEGPGFTNSGSSGFLVGGTGHERASKRPHLRTVDRWNADWGALALMVERWLVPLIPFPSYKLCASDRPGAVKGARFARRSEPLTARTDLESYEGEGKGILQPSSHLPAKNPEEPKLLTGR